MPRFCAWKSEADPISVSRSFTVSERRDPAKVPCLYAIARSVEPNKALKPGVGLVVNDLHWSAGAILQEVFADPQFVGLKHRPKQSSSSGADWTNVEHVFDNTLKDKGSSSMKFRLKQSDQVCGFLDKGTNTTGELESAGTLRIDGTFQGSISTADNLIVGRDAVVHADIKVAEIEIHGRFSGSIEAKNGVEIFPTGRVQGDIRTPVLRVSAGAMLDAMIRMADERPADRA
jgi:cytoskeletal protein CcmA (bactofilin family)